MSATLWISKDGALRRFEQGEIEIFLEEPKDKPAPKQNKQDQDEQDPKK